MKKFLNESDYEFIDISSEGYREYRFPNGEYVKIDNPQKLSISQHGHRVWDGQKSHYIPIGWIHLYWEAKDGQPHFVR
jgi:hypothetical protein